MATDLGYVILIGFGSMKLTQLYKEVARRIGLHQLAWWKSMVNLVCCAVLVVLIVNRSVSTRFLIGLAAAGLAALLHGLDTVLRSYRDELISEVMSRTNTTRRR
jgi:hypothetical protein